MSEDTTIINILISTLGGYFVKKAMRIVVILFIFVLAACDSSEKTATNHDTDTAAEQDENKEEEKKEPEMEEDGKNEKASAEPSESSEAAYKISDNWSIVPINDANEEVVLVTIDDAPDEHALEMAKTLKNLGVGAIFFVNGHFLETDEEKEDLKKIYEMGFLIGNHTYSHPFLPDLSKDKQKEEIIKVNDMVEEVIGERPKFFRAPNGANTDYTEQIVEEENMTLMNWSYGYDWEPEYQSKEAITDIMLNTELLGDGANLLMHDREWTAEALFDIVTGLQEKGYEIVNPKLIQTEK